MSLVILLYESDYGLLLYDCTVKVQKRAAVDCARSVLAYSCVMFFRSVPFMLFK